MNPKITCTSCGADLQWGISKCGSCGVSIDWPRPAADRTAAPPPAPSLTAGLPIKSIAIVVVVIGVAVAALEYFTGTPNVPSTASSLPSAQEGAASGANMAALPHIQELEAQVSADPDNLRLRTELGNHLMDNRFYDKAIAVYKQVLERVPTDANVRVDMGICYKELGDLEAAEREMKTALTHQPRHQHGNFNLGIVRLVQGDVQGASDWFRKSVEIDPQSDLGKRAKQLLDQHMSVPTQ